jgi:hypothetical protein
MTGWASMNINFSSKVYLILVLFFSLLITWPLFIQGYFFHHDDLQVMRIFEMRKCFEDLQIPCRWVPDMGYGNGFPLYNYYSALPYYIGTILSFGLSFVNAAKVLFFIPLVLGGVSMFLLAQKLFGREAGFLSAILYAYAPYRALDSYVRGAVAESFALAIIPLCFYFSLSIIENPTRKNIVLGSLTLAAFLLSHNIMTMFFMPFLLVWNLIFLYSQKWKNWKAVTASILLGIGLSAFFLLPVFLEKNLVRTETLIEGGSNFRTHFVGVGQLFLDRFWGYGGSVFGPNDTISFQVGWPLWWFVVIAVPVLLFNFKKSTKISSVAIFLFLMFLVSIFMQHNRSAFIWEAVDSLQYAQFPWRFLSLSIFSAALLAGLVFYYLKFPLRTLVIWVAVISAIALNWNFFQPREFYPWINDQNKLADPLWEIQQKAGILDYLPKTAVEPFGRAPNNIEVLSGSAEGLNYNVRSNKFSVDVNVIQDAYIQVPVFDFPNWTVYVNGKETSHDNKPNFESKESTAGRIGFTLTQGNYKIEGIFKDTLIRIISNTLTIISLIILVIIYTNKKVFKVLSR